jgi:hypothetical protein
MSYIFNVLIGIDCLASAVLAGQPGESLSGRAGSAYLEGKWTGQIFCPAIDMLMHVVGEYPTWRGHCVAAIKGDELRAQAVLAQRV